MRRVLLLISFFGVLTGMSAAKDEKGVPYGNNPDAATICKSGTRKFTTKSTIRFADRRRGNTAVGRRPAPLHLQLLQ
jgi:hypothetical protein